MAFKLWLGLVMVLAAAIIGADANIVNSGESSARKVIIVDIAKFNFTPAEIRIPAGSTVKWINKDTFIHTVTSGVVEKGRRNTTKNPDGKFDSGDLKQGEAFTTTFVSEGVYPYYCDTHPFMEGRVIVE
jgi:plastocyanin